MKRKIGFLIALVAILSAMLVPAGFAAADTEVLVVVYDKELTLDNKVFDAGVPWTRITSDSVGGALKYNDSGSEFLWSLTATVVVPDVDYALIYYADEPDRFVNWGGDNPGFLLGTATAVGNTISASGTSGYMDIDLPCPMDANQFEINYGLETVGGTGDGYITQHGAKIWLVPVADYNEATKALTAWNPVNYLFETDLIWFDTDGVVSNIVSVSAPSSVDFGDVIPGNTVSKDITITVGNIPTTVTVTNSNTGLFDPANLTITDPGAIVAAGTANVTLTLTVPGTYASGPATGSVLFVASPTEAIHTTH